MIILALHGHYSLLPKMRLIMFLRDLPTLSKMRRTATFLPLNRTMGENSRMRSLISSAANMESNITSQHQGLHNKME